MSRENILVLANPSDTRHRTALYGAQIAKALGATATLIHVEKGQDLGPLAKIYPDFEEKRKELASFFTEAHTKELEKKKDFLAEQGLYVQTKSISAGSFDETLEAFNKLKPRLVIVPREEESLKEYFFGSLLSSIKEDLIRKSPFPVLVHSGLEYRPTKLVVVPVALQGLSQTSVDIAGVLSNSLKAKIKFIHITGAESQINDLNNVKSLTEIAIDQSQKKQAEILVSKIESLNSGDTDHEFELIQTSERPKEKLLNMMEDLKPELIVMASSGKKALERLYLGSYCEYMVKNTSSNILIVKAP